VYHLALASRPRPVGVSRDLAPPVRPEFGGASWSALASASATQSRHDSTGWFLGQAPASRGVELSGMTSRLWFAAPRWRFCQEVCKRDQAAAFDFSSRLAFLMPST
jgi:hypothetical protein